MFVSMPVSLGYVFALSCTVSQNDYIANCMAAFSLCHGPSMRIRLALLTITRCHKYKRLSALSRDRSELSAEASLVEHEQLTGQ